MKFKVGTRVEIACIAPHSYLDLDATPEDMDYINSLVGNIGIISDVFIFDEESEPLYYVEFEYYNEEFINEDSDYINSLSIDFVDDEPNKYNVRDWFSVEELKEI